MSLAYNIYMTFTVVLACVVCIEQQQVV